MKAVRILALIGLVGCALPSPDQSTASNDTTPDETPAASLAPLSLSGAPSSRAPLAWDFALTLDNAAPLQLTCDEMSVPHERHQITSGAATHFELTLAGLKADTAYLCVARLQDGSSRQSPPVIFTTPPLPEDLQLETRISLQKADPGQVGYTLFNTASLNPNFTYSRNYLVILGPDGNVRWFYRGIGGGDIDATWLGGGRILVGGWGGGDNHYAPTILGLDRQTYFEGTSSRTSSLEVEGSFNHDAGLSADGRSVFTFTNENAEDGTWLGFVIKQIDLTTNDNLWSWDSIHDGVNTGALPAGSSDVPDPFHANAIDDRWENGRLYLYVSLKHQSQVLKIDYETGAIVWRLGINGDFKLLESDGRPATKDRWFFNQHDAKMVGGRMALYDNGQGRSIYGGSDYSRALTLDIDERLMTARIASEYAETGWNEPIWGGYDLLPDGHSLVAMGHCWLIAAGYNNSALVMLDASGAPVWRADFADSRQMLYRAQHIDACAAFNNVSLCPR